MASQKVLSKSYLNQIKREKTRVGGKKVVTDDVKKLKSLAGKPMIPRQKIFDYYIEPVVIEYYIPKESRFAYETKYIYIELDDPLPKNENHKLILEHFKKRNTPIDVMDVMNNFPQFLLPILEHYNPKLGIFETMSIEIANGMAGDHIAYRRVLYLNEVLRKTEPSMPALEILGDFTTYNINWCIRYLNRHGIEHSCEDRTVHYLIKLHKMKLEREGKVVEERFEILTEIYLEQAFPTRDEDIYEDIEFPDEYKFMRGF